MENNGVVDSFKGFIGSDMLFCLNHYGYWCHHIASIRKRSMVKSIYDTIYLRLCQLFRVSRYCKGIID